MDLTNDAPELSHTLVTLFELTRAGRPDAGALARQLETSPTRVARALVRLERRGLADASRARLTMRGLAAAAALQAERPCAGAGVPPTSSAPARTLHEELPAERAARGAATRDVDEAPSALATSSP